MCHLIVQRQTGAAEFVPQMRPKLPAPSSSVDHCAPFARPYLDTGGISFIAQVAGRGSRCGSANAPEFQLQSRVVPLLRNCSPTAT